MNARPLALLLALAACRQAPPAPAAQPAAVNPGPPADKLTLLFSASVAGQLVPCGCSPDQRGGLPRAVSLVKKLRAQAPNFLFADAGDLLFETPSRPPPQLLTQRTLKARALARGDELMGAAARAVGLRDLALGAGFLREASGAVPLLDAGQAAVPGARASILVKAGEIPVGLFAAGGEANPARTIAARAKGLREQGARLLVLFVHPRGDNSFSAAQALLPAAKAAGVDLVVVGRRDDPATDPDRKDLGSPPLLAVEGHGQSLLRVDVQLGQGPLTLARGAADRSEDLKALDARIDRFRAQLAENPDRRAQLEGKIHELEERKRAAGANQGGPAQGATLATVTFLPLTEDAGEDAEAKQLVAAYDKQVTALNLAEAKTQPERCPAPHSGEAAFAGATSCATCHQSQAEFWKQTRHARAYETLVKVDKQFSLDCIRCHVAGWQQPGGVCRIDRTEVGGKGLAGSGVGRRDVQCESCHGAGSEHVNDPPGHIQSEVLATACMRCHEAANSPHFDDVKYRPFIVGPGHGAKLARGEKPHPRQGSPLQ